MAAVVGIVSGLLMSVGSPEVAAAESDDLGDARAKTVRFDSDRGGAAASFVSVAGAPRNDMCADAILVTDGLTPIHNLGATTDGPDERIACAFFSETQVKSDVWYEYEASCTGDLTVSLCNSPGWDTRLAVYEGCGRCPAEPPADACNDDLCGHQSQVRLPVTFGTCYRIRVGGFGDDQGSGEMAIQCEIPPPPQGACCVRGFCAGTVSEAQCSALGGGWFEGEDCATFACPPPAHDECVNAIEVFTDTPVTGSTGSATGGDLTSLPPCDGEDLNDVWHYWTADCTGTATFSLCGSPFDSTLSVFDSCGGAEAGCDDDGCGFRSASKLAMDVTSGVTYTLRVAGVAGATGAYTLNVETCVDPTPRACCGNDFSGDPLCLLFDPAFCASLSGATPQGPGTVCDANESCCFPDGSCRDMSPACCLGDGGTPGGFGTICEGDNDGTGVDDACEDFFTWKDHNGDTVGGYLPDFDQNRDFDDADGDGDPTTDVELFYGGAAAAADLIWWLDHRYPGLNVVTAGVDVATLIQDLGARMATNAQVPSPWGHVVPWNGAFVDDVQTALRSYFNAEGIGTVFDERLELAPSYTTVANEIVGDGTVALLLGFYHVESVASIPGSGFRVQWRRTGGHYVAVAGVDSATERIAVSDPDDDGAESGRAGDVRGIDHDHDHDATPGTSLPFRDTGYDHGKHEVKDFASHDFYDAVGLVESSPGSGRPIPGGAWVLADVGDPLAYAVRVEPFQMDASGGSFDVAAPTFMSTTFLVDSGFPDPVVCQTYTVVEAAVIVSPSANLQACCHADGSCTDVTAAACRVAGGTYVGPGTACLTDVDGSGVDDVCEACAAASIAGVFPSSDTVDARQPSEPGQPLPRLGIGTSSESIRVALDPGVEGAARCFALCESAADPALGPNAIAGVTDLGGGAYEIVFEHAIAAGAATTLQYAGDAGFVAYIAHPGNVSGDAAADGGDVVDFIDCCLNGTCGGGFDLYSCDVDRSGVVTASDMLRVIDLLNGASTWDAWLGTLLPSRGVCP